MAIGKKRIAKHWEQLERLKPLSGKPAQRRSANNARRAPASGTSTTYNPKKHTARQRLVAAGG
jgi:hypothetical protein